MARIVVAMSGGVDSSVVAYLLKEQGHEVIGITLYVKEENDDRFNVKKCCSLADIQKAREISSKLDIPHYIIDVRDRFKEEVIDYFVKSYEAGETPNPCIRCNRKIKFGDLLRHSRKIDADFLATGHYARVEYDKTRQRYLLRHADERNKDQSYFLYSLRQAQLKYSMFPLGNIRSKQETKSISALFDSSLNSKKESQDVCFIEGNDYRIFLKKYLPERKGPFIFQKTGEVIGYHNGYYFYTIGQRRGLNISWSERLYVVKIIPEKNEVVLGLLEDALKKQLVVKNLNFIYYERPPKRFDALCQIRYKGELIKSEITIKDRQAFVSLKRPAFAVTPGQAAVFFDLTNEYAIGGGMIE